MEQLFLAELETARSRGGATYLSVALMLGVTGVVAALIPARRAAGVNPTTVLSEST